MRSTVIAGLAVVLLLSSCDPRKIVEEVNKRQNARKTEVKAEGLVKAYYGSGELRAAINYKNGKRHGVAKEYYKSGTLLQQIDYVDDVQHGHALKYYENGKLYQDTPYSMGKIEGIQKRYWLDGTLSAEIPYSGGHQCLGLKEYKANGEIETRYPKINVSAVDKTREENAYYIKLSMSGGLKTVAFYLGELTDGKCLHDELLKVADVESGVGTVGYSVPPGMMLRDTLPIIAKVKTPQGNYFIAQRTYHVEAVNYKAE